MTVDTVTYPFVYGSQPSSLPSIPDPDPSDGAVSLEGSLVSKWTLANWAVGSAAEVSSTFENYQLATLKHLREAAAWRSAAEHRKLLFYQQLGVSDAPGVRMRALRSMEIIGDQASIIRRATERIALLDSLELANAFSFAGQSVGTLGMIVQLYNDKDYLHQLSKNFAQQLSIPDVSDSSDAELGSYIDSLADTSVGRLFFSAFQAWQDCVQ